MSKYSLETIKRIYHDDTGEFIEIGEDSDGLGLLEIRTRTELGKINQAITFTREQTPLIIKALQELIETK